MIRSVSLGKEIVIDVENKVGILASMSRILADHGINIEGVAGYQAGNDARLMFVVTDTLRAKEALQKAGYNKIRESEVVVIDLENKPGALKGITAKMAVENIDIRYIYGTTCSEGCPARMIVATANNEKALIALKKK